MRSRRRQLNLAGDFISNPFDTRKLEEPPSTIGANIGEIISISK